MIIVHYFSSASNLSLIQVNHVFIKYYLFRNLFLISTLQYLLVFFIGSQNFQFHLFRIIVLFHFKVIILSHNNYHLIFIISIKGKPIFNSIHLSYTPFA